MFRLSRGSGVAVVLAIVLMLIAWAPMMALADSGNSQAPAVAPGLSEEAPGNSGEAPGQLAQTETETEAPPGNSGDAPGQNETETSDVVTTESVTTESNAGGNSDSHQSTESTGVPEGKGDGPTTGVGGNCDGDPSGGSNTGNGANTSGDFDNTCDTSDSGPAPNGNGRGGAKGKPCAGCVGNADDKNPPGQSKGDDNSGYECEPDGGKGKGNKGVGVGNPAHTGCEPGDDDPPTCPEDSDQNAGEEIPEGETEDSFCEDDKKVTICHATGSETNPWEVITISENALAKHLEHGDKVVAEGTEDEDCDDVDPPTCPEDSDQNAGEVIPEGESEASFCDETDPPTCPEDSDQNAGEVIPEGETEASFCDDDPDPDTCPEDSDQNAGEVIPEGETAESFCDLDDVDPATCPEDSDQNAGEVIPEGETAESFCELDDVDPVAITCPEDATQNAGEVIPEGETETSFCVEDEVLGEIIDKDPKPSKPEDPLVAGEVLGKAEPQGAVLPFTGGSVLPIVIVGLTLLGAGGATLYRRREASDEEAAA